MSSAMSKLIFGDESDDDMSSNKKGRKTTVTIDINLSEIVVTTSEIYEEKYRSYFVTRKKVNINIIGDNSLSSIQEFQLYQLLHAIDREDNVIDVKYKMCIILMQAEKNMPHIYR